MKMDSNFIPGQLHGNLSGFAETLLDLDIQLAEHNLLAMGMVRVFAEHITKSQWGHHWWSLVQNAWNTLHSLPNTRKSARTVVGIHISITTIFFWPILLNKFKIEYFEIRIKISILPVGRWKSSSWSTWPRREEERDCWQENGWWKDLHPCEHNKS